MVNITLINVQTKDIRIEMIQTAHKTVPSALKFFQVLSSSYYLATFKPQLIPKAMASKRNDTRYVRSIQKNLFFALTPRFSQKISIGSAALST